MRNVHHVIEQAHAHSASEVAEALGTDIEKGLAQTDISPRQRRYGLNKLRRHARKSVWSIVAHQFKSIIVWLLTAAAAFSLFLNDYSEAIAIAVVLFLNGLIGFAAEFRAARSMEALLHIAQVRARVRRDGKVRMINARDLVPGDVILLEAGDVVTADLRLTRASNLQSDESVLTGESSPVEKTAEAVDEGATVVDRSCMVFKGAAMTRGSGEGIVTATGMATEIGKISDLVQKAEAGTAPLERRLDRLGHRLVWLTLGLALLTVIAGVLRGHATADMIQTGVALAVAAVPEGLPVVATLCLAQGMWRMAARNAVITNLSSVETLGATTAILTDKTGTLTENRMTVVRYLLSGGDLPVSWSGTAVHIKSADAQFDPRADERLTWALRIGALCNAAEPGDGRDDTDLADPMETALVSVADAAMADEDIRQRYKTISQNAFDPDLKMMATVHHGDQGYLIAVKGAPEALLAVCDTELTAQGPRAMSDAIRADWTTRNTQAASEGLRLLGLAMKWSDHEDDDLFDGLTLVGLVCLLDPLRADVPDAIRASIKAGVKVVVLTGDHANTAETIARQAGLGRNGIKVTEGAALSGIDVETVDQETVDELLNTSVFARVAPDTKLKLVSIYQKNGHIVAMTGDGVNDAPALKKADIGIAMGQRGTQVAREAAAMVLTDDAFGTIIEAMRQGRVIFDNIRRFVVYLMSCNVSEVLVVGLAVGLGLPSPLLPLQILFLNLVTDVFPAFALGFGRGDHQIMERPPRDPSESIVSRRQWELIGLLGLLITAATLGAFVIALFRFQLEPEQAVTVAFLTLALAQLWNVFNMRDPASGWIRNEITRNRYVWAALVFCVGLIAIAVSVPSASALLELPNPGLAGLALAVCMSFVPLVSGQALAVVRRDG